MKWVRIAFGLAVAMALLIVPPGAGAAAGLLDPTFGSDGRVTTIFDVVCDEEPEDETLDRALAVAVQPDGRIVAAGAAGCSTFWGGENMQFGLARYHPSGTLDAGFGDDADAPGRARTDFGDDDLIRELALQPDGKIVAAGETTLDGVRHFALARYHPDGSLDSSFGDGGRIVTGFGDQNASIWDVAIQNNGRIVVAGGATSPRGGSDFALVRYLSDGSLDAGFGNGGTVTTDFGSNDWALGMAVQNNGRIVVAGQTRPADGWRFALARYTSNGSLDASFGDGGRVTTTFGDPVLDPSAVALDVAIDAEGRAVAAGWVSEWHEDEVGGTSESVESFALARYLSNGTLDPWFGIAGRVTTNFDDESSDQARAVAIQDNGRIVVGGVTNNPVFFGSADNFGLVRYLPDGTVDFGFGSGGRVTTSFGGRDRGEALAIQKDGKLIAAGHSRIFVDNRFHDRFALARYLASPDTAPEGLGLTTPPRRERPWELTATLTDPDTRELVLGAPIRFLVDGRVVAETETDRTGTATAPMPRGLNARSMVRAEFDGDGERRPLSVEARYDPRSGISASAADAL